MNISTSRTLAAAVAACCLCGPATGAALAPPANLHIGAPTTPPPTAGQWPDATNTGYKNAPGYPGHLTPFTGTLQSGQTYKFYDFTQGLAVPCDVSNVTFYGSRFAYTQTDPNNNANVVIGDHYKTCGNNIVFDYVTFQPRVVSSPPTAYSQGYGYGIDQRGDVQITVDHSDFWGFGGGIQMQYSSQARPVVVRNTWFHDARDDGGGVDHTDGILDNWGGQGYMIFDHNKISSVGNTQGLSLAGGNGYTNVTITNNYFSGFGYTVAIGGKQNNRNVVFTDNTFGTDIQPYFGPLYPGWTDGNGNLWRRNKWHVVPNSYYKNSADDGKYWTPNGVSATDWNQ